MSPWTQNVKQRKRNYLDIVFLQIWNFWEKTALHKRKLNRVLKKKALRNNKLKQMMVLAKMYFWVF